MKLSLAYSTDLDDAFMFWPLATGRLDPRAYGFDGAEHVRSDTATLNGWAREGVHDVVAVSIAAVPSLARDWLLLPHGGSVGRNYGPVIVAPHALSVEELPGLRVGVPGATTTCARLVALAAPGAVQVEVPSAPLERAFAALADGIVDACALIHEGRLTYAERGLQLVCDLGKFWHGRATCPSRSAATSSSAPSATTPSRARRRCCRLSIAYALGPSRQALDELAGDRGLSRAQADEYLASTPTTTRSTTATTAAAPSPRSSATSPSPPNNRPGRAALDASAVVGPADGRLEAAWPPPPAAASARARFALHSACALAPTTLATASTAVAATRLRHREHREALEMLDRRRRRQPARLLVGRGDADAARRRHQGRAQPRAQAPPTPHPQPASPS